MRSLPFAVPVLASLLVAGLAVPALSQPKPPPPAPSLTALRPIAHGLWELREKGSQAAPQRICVRDPMALVQVRHGAAACSRFVIENLEKRGTVYYTCPGAGHGQTSIRVESPQLLQIESQGIADQSPFNFSYEARFAGACR